MKATTGEERTNRFATKTTHSDDAFQNISCNRIPIRPLRDATCHAAQLVVFEGGRQLAVNRMELVFKRGSRRNGVQSGFIFPTITQLWIIGEKNQLKGGNTLISHC